MASSYGPVCAVLSDAGRSRLLPLRRCRRREPGHRARVLSRLPAQRLSIVIIYLPPVTRLP